MVTTSLKQWRLLRSTYVMKPSLLRRGRNRFTVVISYDPDNHPDNHYLLSYSSLRDDYLRYTMMSDEEFAADLLNILHFTCITCWLKEKKAQHLLGDTGLI